MTVEFNRTREPMRPAFDHCWARICSDHRFQLGNLYDALGQLGRSEVPDHAQLQIGPDAIMARWEEPVTTEAG